MMTGTAMVVFVPLRWTEVEPGNPYQTCTRQRQIYNLPPKNRKECLRLQSPRARLTLDTRNKTHASFATVDLRRRLLHIKHFSKLNCSRYAREAERLIGPQIISQHDPEEPGAQH
jgi:hypothetical protein